MLLKNIANGKIGKTPTQVWDKHVKQHSFWVHSIVQSVITSSDLRCEDLFRPLTEQVPLLSYCIKYLGNFVNNSSADLVTRGVFNWFRCNSQEMSPALIFLFLFIIIFLILASSRTGSVIFVHILAMQNEDSDFGSRQPSQYFTTIQTRHPGGQQLYITHNSLCFVFLICSTPLVTSRLCSRLCMLSWKHIH